MSAAPLMPAAFLGHGSPMNALERNRFTEAWRAFGASVPRPRAILVVSAHWYVNATAVTAMPRPRTIHDFFGFPQALFDVQYPAPGLPELAEEVADVAHPDYVGADRDGWGLDHGTWSVLVHAFPDADIPVVQLSINAQKPAEFHVALGAKLAALRASGILVVGSGNVVHNLRAIDWKQPDSGFDWNQRFDADAMQVLAERPGDAAALIEHADYAASAPTAEHFLPLLYLAGIAAASGKGADVLVEGAAYGSLSMTSYTVGATCPPDSAISAGAAPLALDTPPDESNL
ncbi:4,5-DOPA dioxygenase extradiol [Luteimonas sp. MC1572]|uniref:4,5-DOPA-extradiol-dioxygenase n=1 Tax=Luteimonas sp. MC1572 TaxID=2799325 RepID=UPI0018F06A78|nr:4,5-DOPA dioxygenase extradiol [Luteimonas sp. MC1572]MBJ6982750.1 4,5-DOPA dioxygenase extradiol [Luteimonas sp. MC1572]QQO03986.1 4,5-DOPA dioxygenase extradiol [Luteimonas sp. MC1572]